VISFLLYSALTSVTLNQRNPREMYFAREAFVFFNHGGGEAQGDVALAPQVHLRDQFFALFRVDQRCIKSAESAGNVLGTGSAYFFACPTRNAFLFAS
jgi:hypothetical protein